MILTSTQIYQPLGEAMSYSPRSAYCHCQEHDVATFKVGTSLLMRMFSLGPKHDRGLENILTGRLISKGIWTTAKIKMLLQNSRCNKHCNDLYLFVYFAEIFSKILLEYHVLSDRESRRRQLHSGPLHQSAVKRPQTHLPSKPRNNPGSWEFWSSTPDTYCDRLSGV